MRIDSTCSKLLKTVGNVTGTDSIYSKLLKTVGLMMGLKQASQISSVFWL